MTKLIVAFRSSPNAPKKVEVSVHANDDNIGEAEV